MKIGSDHRFAKFVEAMILAGYSPDATLGYIKDHNLNFDTKICRVTLYSYIDKGVFCNITNKNLLRKSRKSKKHKTVRKAKKLPNIEHSIEKRPKEIFERSSFGHWELDSIIGNKNKGRTILSFTERLTRMQLVVVSKDKTAMSTVDVINRIEKKIGTRAFRKIFKSFTCDNGTEFSNTLGMEYSPITGRKRTSVWYCHPYCSSERGSNENQNGFVRRFIHKGTPISNYTLSQIHDIQDFINNYPRKIFNYRSSLSMFESELSKLGLQKKLIFF